MLAPRPANANGNQRVREFIPHHFVNFKNQHDSRVLKGALGVEIGAAQKHIQGVPEVLIELFLVEESAEKPL